MPSQVLVTGAGGRLGRYVVAELTGHGMTVVAVDRREPKDTDELPEGTHFIPIELTNASAVHEAMTGCDGVVHLGAYPTPNIVTDDLTFANNTHSTFNVLLAAEQQGIENAVIASSVSALGTAYAPEPFAPQYVPIDEDHPLLPHDPYALSKQVDEQTGQMFVRRSGMNVIAMRFHWIALPGEAKARAPQVSENPGGDTRVLWGYVDVRDAARACRLALDVTDVGFQKLHIVAADTMCTQPTAELVTKFLPDAEIRGELSGTASGWSIERARKVLGWEPEYGWRDDDE
jgi:nucleoside-diphosphate-sugar epimerase